ncbi:hypothetical protein [Sagittula salina]|nr:hypothetical protein [Sagittula salina]
MTSAVMVDTTRPTRAEARATAGACVARWMATGGHLGAIESA